MQDDHHQCMMQDVLPFSKKKKANPPQKSNARRIGRRVCFGSVLLKVNDFQFLQNSPMTKPSKLSKPSLPPCIKQTKLYTPKLNFRLHFLPSTGVMTMAMRYFRFHIMAQFMCFSLDFMPHPCQLPCRTPLH
jgi:hypothetical protein